MRRVGSFRKGNIMSAPGGSIFKGLLDTIDPLVPNAISMQLQLMLSRFTKFQDRLVVLQKMSANF